VEPAAPGSVLGATLDLDAVLQQMTEIAVPRMGDWCAIFMRGERESIRCVAFVHRDQAKTELGRAYIRARPISIDAPFGVGKVIRTGVSELTGEVSEEQLRAVSRDEEGVRVPHELGHGSVLIVPLRVGAAVIGAVSMGRAEANAYDPTDRAAAVDLAGRLALAIQNAELYRDAREARARAERASWQSAFLAEASRLLASSVDYGATLDGLIRLSVPTIADGAVVHLVRRDGVKRIGPAYADPRSRRSRRPRSSATSSRTRSSSRRRGPAGGGVALTLERLDGRARLVVTDTGPGIGADVLPHVFDRFRQGDSSSTRLHGGLAIREAHRGTARGNGARGKRRAAGRRANRHRAAGRDLGQPPAARLQPTRLRRCSTKSTTTYSPSFSGLT